MKTTRWLDITQFFLQASSCLTPGELVHESTFSLYDAMSAIELTDSKMDAIVQWDSFPGYPRSYKEALRKGQLKLNGHTPTQLIGIFDEAISCMATWLKGHTLAQTLFTCLYLLDVEQCESLFLRAFTVTIVKIAEYLREIIAKGGVYTEEDQQIICVGFNMLNSYSDESVLATLKTAKERLISISKTSIHPKDCNNVLIDGPLSMTSQLNKEWEKPLTEALLVRVKFLRSLFIVVSNLSKRSRESLSISEQELPQCMAYLKSIVSSLSLGKPLDPSNPIELGFHPLVNQHLLPPSYREYGILSRPESTAFIYDILSELHHLYRIGRLNSLSEVFLSASKLSTVDSSPNVVVRSLVAQLCLSNDRSNLFGSKSIENMIKDEVRSLFNPPSLNLRSPLSSTPLVNDIVDRFLGNLHLPYVDLLRVYCQHRACQRGVIGKYLENVCEIQQESESVDQQLHSLTQQLDPQRQHLSCYCTWLVYYVSHLFIDYIVLGFEYNLYSQSEFHYIYWYLEYSYGWKQMALKTAARLLSQEPHLQTKNKKKVKGKKKELPREREVEIALLNVKRSLCIALMRTYEALLLDEKITKPHLEFGSEALIFRNRFLPFSSVVTPQPLAYTNYHDLAGIEQYKCNTSLNLYETASSQFNTTKCALEALNLIHDQEVCQLLKVIKTNLVIMKLAATGHKGEAPPSWDFSVHRVFPIIRMN